MPYRKDNLAAGEVFHLLSRGNNKQIIFHDNRDYIRFLFTILFFQSPIKFSHLSQYVKYFEKHRKFQVSKKIISEIVASRTVELHSFGLMPNHFHLSATGKKDGALSKYLQRIIISATKYNNEKYKDLHIGHLFQGAFKSVLIADNTQLLHLSAYIHRNARELPGWKDKEHFYPWSSYQDYIGENRWGELLKTDLILDQFKNKEEYKHFVDTSPAKTFDEFDPTSEIGA